MKQATFFMALLGAIFLVGCGGNGDTTSQSTFNNGSGDQPFKPTTHLSHRSLVTNYYAGQLQVMDATQDRLTSSTFAAGTQPTYMQSSPDGTLTFVYNSGANTISSLNNNLEAVKGTINLGGWTESFVTSVSNKFGFAAVYNYSNGTFRTPGAINRFNPTDGSLNTQIPFPNVRYLALDTSEKHMFAFTDVEDSAHWVDLTSSDVNQLPVLSVISLTDASGNPVLLSRPVAAFFTADNKAYILSCGQECGGASSPSVTEVDASTVNYSATTNTGTATVIKQWSVSGARRGLIDLVAGKLYVVGSTSNLIDSGGHNVQDGYFTVIDLNAQTASQPIRIGNGAKRLIRNINGVFWVGSTDCGVQSCVSLVNPTANTFSTLATANGDATGISLSVNSKEVYTIEGGELYIYNQKGTPVSSQYNTDVKGQAYDVLYID